MFGGPPVSAGWLIPQSQHKRPRLKAPPRAWRPASRHARSREANQRRVQKHGENYAASESRIPPQPHPSCACSPPPALSRDPIEAATNAAPACAATRAGMRSAARANCGNGAKSDSLSIPVAVTPSEWTPESQGKKARLPAVTWQGTSSVPAFQRKSASPFAVTMNRCVTALYSWRTNTRGGAEGEAAGTPREMWVGRQPATVPRHLTAALTSQRACAIPRGRVVPSAG